jgi:hypothetical protein
LATVMERMQPARPTTTKSDASHFSSADRNGHRSWPSSVYFYFWVAGSWTMSFLASIFKNSALFPSLPSLRLSIMLSQAVATLLLPSCKCDAFSGGSMAAQRRSSDTLNCLVSTRLALAGESKPSIIFQHGRSILLSLTDPLISGGQASRAARGSSRRNRIGQRRKR